MTATDAGPAGGQEGDRAERALELLDRQLAAYEELDALASRQRGLIDADDTDGLLALLAQRHCVIERLTELSGDLGPIRAHWDRLARGLSEPDRQRCRQTIDRIAELAGAISDRDASDRAALERRRGAMAGELSSLRAGRGALAAYGPQRGASARYQDSEA